jgi:predicted ATPase
MILKKVNYKEFSPEDPKNNYWELGGLVLGTTNLIVGKNASGKTRTVNLIRSFASIIFDSTRIIQEGYFEVVFIMDDAKELKYDLELRSGKIIKELIVIDGETKLDRSTKETTIESAATGRNTIQPPDDKLVLHIRRDKAEYPFFEDLYTWASNVRGYKFANYDPNLLQIPSANINMMRSLNMAPFVFDKLTPDSILEVIKDFNLIGYGIEEATLGQVAGTPLDLKLIFIKEKGVKYPIQQTEISNGMMRAFALLVMIQYLLDEEKDQKRLVLIDDFGEGLDYERTRELAKIIFSKMNRDSIQFIATSNHELLMNVVDIKNWNIIEREGTKVSALNYENSKERFDDFQLTGLNNFDLLASSYLKKRGT